MLRACMLCHFSRVWLCNSMDCSLPGCPVCGILQARKLEWVAILSSRGSSWPRDQKTSCIASGSLPSELPGWCQKVRVLLQSEAGVNSHVTKHHSWGMDMWKSESESRSLVSDSLRPHGLHSPWNSPGQNPGVGSLSLLQGIFPIQGSNPGLPHCRWILYQLSHKGNPRVLEWVAYPFSSGSFWPRNWPGVSCTACRFFTNWAIMWISA